MTYDEFNGMQTAYPDDIATALLDEISDLISNSDNYDSVYHELIECLYQIMAIAENRYNQDYWRTFYKVLSDIAENRG